MVLPVLVRGKGHLLDPPLALPHVLLGIPKATILSVQLRLQLPDAGLHLDHGLAASLESIHLSLISTGLGILALGFQQLAVTLQTLGNVLLGTQLIG